MRKTTIVGAMALVWCLACASSAFAATTGVSGVAKSIATGSTLSRVKVAKGSVSVTTNGKGAYILKLKPGTYTLSAGKTGRKKTYQVVKVVKGKTTKVNWYLTKSYPTNAVPSNPVTVLGWNDLGMHCSQDSYKYMSILPPYNNLHVQLFAGEEGESPNNVSVTYAFAKKTDPSLHTDFWTYASSFGWNLEKNVGITGNSVAGTMTLSGRSYTATGIPVTPFDDDGTWDPYGAATITVRRNSDQSILATANVVAPVSTELSCGKAGCHGDTGTLDASAAIDILTLHDDDNGTSLLSAANGGHPRACSECHGDNALGAVGGEGMPSLSEAIHKKHDGKVANTTTGCSSCHPGPKTKCMRGVMAAAGKGCVSCHGTMNKVWTTARNGRRPWLDEPKCGTCHGSRYAENTGKLYRDSLLKNALEDDMDNRIYCEACHNSTHAEYISKNASDAVVPKKFQGNSYWIYNCKVCHKTSDSEFKFTGQSMHR